MRSIEIVTWDPQGLRGLFAGEAATAPTLRTAAPEVLRVLSGRLRRARARVVAVLGVPSPAAVPSALSGLGLDIEAPAPYWHTNPPDEIDALLATCSNDVGADQIVKYECAYGVIMKHLGEQNATANIAFGVQAATRLAADQYEQAAKLAPYAVGTAFDDRIRIWRSYAATLQTAATQLRGREDEWRKRIAQLHEDTRFFAEMRDDLIVNAKDYTEPARTELLADLEAVLLSFRPHIVRLVDLSLTEVKLALQIQQNIVKVVTLALTDAADAHVRLITVTKEYLTELHRELACDFLCQIGRGIHGAVDTVFHDIPAAIGKGAGEGAGNFFAGLIDGIVKPLLLPAVLFGGGYVGYQVFVKDKSVGGAVKQGARGAATGAKHAGAWVKRKLA